MIGLRNKSVNVNRTQLLKSLYENREKHIQNYNSALAGYKQAMIDKLNETLKLVKKDKIKSLSISLPEPTSHESSYTEAIEMLEYSVDDTINLDQEAFRAFIKDEWNWSAYFNNLVASYSK